MAVQILITQTQTDTHMHTRTDILEQTDFCRHEMPRNASFVANKYWPICIRHSLCMLVCDFEMRCTVGIHSQGITLRLVILWGMDERKD